MLIGRVQNRLTSAAILSHYSLTLKEIEMKKLLVGAIALSVLGAATVASAAPYQGYGRDNYRPGYSQGQGYGHRYNPPRRHWRQGQRLPAAYWSRGQYVDYRQHRLRAPPRGYRWVRADNDYALVAITTGLIAAIVAANN